jgi:hypothetical protein
MPILSFGRRARLAAELLSFFPDAVLPSTLAAAMITGHDASFRTERATQGSCHQQDVARIKEVP